KLRFHCLQCAKTFSTQGHLSRHSRIHSGVKNYTCNVPECHHRFSRSDAAKQHRVAH
ncbi:hypothetical protein BC830DRAFT_1054448, partial [Chytriomyces sp. MP71]